MRTYYRDEMCADSQSFSPSASKPAKVIDDWRAAGLDIDVKKPIPVSAETMALAHDPEYVRKLLACETPNGFGNTSPEVARSLPFTVGAMVAATKYALKTGENAAALCSGFHHATYDSAGGFCSVNGLIVAAQVALKGGARKVGVLDLDEHFGNGSEDIIRKLKLKSRVKHWTGGAHFTRAEQAELFLESLAGLIKSMFYDCDVLIYQAGADPWVKDPLGGWLTMDELRERDRIVFETAHQMRLPVAWNLAGGYSTDENGEITPVLAIHRQTAEECIAVSTSKLRRAS